MSLGAPILSIPLNIFAVPQKDYSAYDVNGHGHKSFVLINAFSLYCGITVAGLEEDLKSASWRSIYFVEIY